MVADGAHFCCEGCRTVFLLLQQHQLCDYYRYAETDGTHGRPITTGMADRYAALDDERTAAAYYDFVSDRSVIARFSVPSIHCPSCLWLLERLDRLVEGVRGSRVDVVRKTVCVTYDPRMTTLAAVATAMAQLGYAPELSTTAGRPKPHRDLIMRLGVAGFATGNVMLLAIANYLAGPAGLPPTIGTATRILSVLLAVPVIVYAASPWWTTAWQALRRRAITMDVAVATGLFVIVARSVVDLATGRGEGYLDSAVGLVFLLLVGRLAQRKAFDAVAFDRDVTSFFPLSVRVERDGRGEVIPVRYVRAGDVLQMRQGDVLPCEAVLDSPVGYLDYAFVTGEALPQEHVRGAALHAGGRVVGSSLRCVATADVDHAVLAGHWQRSSRRVHRSRLASVSERFSVVFLLFAFTTAIAGAMYWLPDWERAIDVASAVLLIACPCAITLAAPMALATAMGRLGRRGIMIRTPETLLDLEGVRSIVFDKTGTITAPDPNVRFHGRALSHETLRALGRVAQESTHPVCQAFGRSVDAWDIVVTDVHNEAGAGITAVADGRRITIGSSSWCREHAVEGLDASHESATVVAVDGTVIGTLHARASLRPSVGDVLQRLRQRYRLQLMSGDTGVDRSQMEVHFDADRMTFGMGPADKAAAVSALVKTEGPVLMVGDGVNDAAAMDAADVAIAVSNGVATMVPACDVVIDGETVVELPTVLAYARAVRRVIVLAFVVSLVYNAVGLSLALSAQLSPLAVAILMPVSSLSVIATATLGVRYQERRLPWTSSSS